MRKRISILMIALAGMALSTGCRLDVVGDGATEGVTDAVATIVSDVILDVFGSIRGTE